MSADDEARRELPALEAVYIYASRFDGRMESREFVGC
jgi:hypothetical protein